LFFYINLLFLQREKGRGNFRKIVQSDFLRQKIKKDFLFALEYDIVN